MENEMIREYFKLNKEQSKEFIKQYYEDINPKIERKTELVNKFQNEFQISGEVVSEEQLLGTLRAIGYEVNKEDKVPEWAEQKEFNCSQSGDIRYYLVPRENFKKGREFQNRLNEINDVKIPLFSDYAVKKFIRVQPNLIYNNTMQYAVSGYHDGIVILSIPTFEDKQPELNESYDFSKIEKFEFIKMMNGE